MKGSIASCYEVREVWGFGCDPSCPQAKEPAQPKPCCRNTSSVSFIREKPLPEDGTPIAPPAGNEKKNRAAPPPR
jgi:hypothetical protein